MEGLQFCCEVKILEEWSRLQTQMRCYSTTTFSAGQCNQHKNRYLDILPYDKNRVLLSTDSNYINASRVNIGEKNFISCQAPLPHTFNDFWCMIWENKTPVIVMLTRLIEGNKIKADCYWPLNCGEPQYYGDICVEMEHVEIGEILTKRFFKLSKPEDGESMRVLHIHYTEWPDFGVPESPANIRRVINEVELFQNEQNSPFSPVVVHCSAGIGRTGTFLAIVSLIEERRNQADSSSTPPIQNIVVNLRDQRMGMVQTLEQYLFIYSAVNSLFDQ